MILCVERGICISTDVGRTYDDTSMLTVDNGFYAGEWGGVDGCVTGSYAYAVQLRVSGTLFLFSSAVRFDFFLEI